MNIALICDYSLDYLGGAQTAFLAEASALADAGHTVVVVSPSSRDTIAGAPRFVAIRATATIPGLGLPLLRNRARVRADLLRIFARNRIDVVHVHSEFGLVAASIDVADDLRIPVIHTVHTFFWQAHLPRPVQGLAAAGIRAFQRWITAHPADTPLPGQPLPDHPQADAALRAITLATARRAAIVVSPSRHQRQRLLAAGVSAVVAVPNTIVTTERRAGEPLRTIDGPLRLVWIGRCAREKRLLEFVEACRGALSRLPSGSLEVEIVGDGPQLVAARLLAADNTGIVFSGRLDSDQVVVALRRAHLVALTSSGFDNQPMTVVEAIYAARGVLYVDAALTEGVDTAGVLCASESVDDMTTAILELAANPQRVVEASRRAATAFDTFSPSSHERHLRAVYLAQLVSLTP